MSNVLAIDEKELLLQLKQGHERAFEQIYKRYSARIYGNILKMVHDDEVAEDLLQEVFVKIWENRAEIDPERSFRSYLFTCSRYLVYNFLRRVSLEKQIEAYLRYGNTELYEHVEADLQYKQTNAALQSAIDQLPPQRKKVFTLCKLEGHSYEEAANMLGISPSTVHDHIVKALRFIKMRMQHTDSAFIAFILSSLLGQ